MNTSSTTYIVMSPFVLLRIAMFGKDPLKQLIQKNSVLYYKGTIFENVFQNFEKF